MLFPAMIATGMSPLAANVTNSVSTWPGYVGGVAGFREELGEQRSRVAPLIGATVAGSTLGCALLLLTPSAAFDIVVPFLVLVATALTAAGPAVRQRFGQAHADGWPSGAGPRVAVGAAAVYGGYFGGGLGVIFLAVLGLVMGGSLRRLNAAKAALTLVDASVSVVVFGLFGPVRWTAVAVAAPATLVGGFVGARVARRIDERLLRIVVVLFGLIAAAWLFFDLAR